MLVCLKYATDFTAHVLFRCFSCHLFYRSTGTSALCTINRSSIYILLWIMISLASLTYDLLHNLKRTPGHAERQKLLNALSVALPVVLVVVAYILDTGDRDVANGVLNVSRHAFNCRCNI